MDAITRSMRISRREKIINDTIKIKQQMGVEGKIIQYTEETLS